MEARNKKIFNEISEKNSVCISVRRGDFFNAENEKTFGVCTIQYYINAVEIMNEKVDAPIYYVFSDDISWCKKNLRFDGEVEFVPQDMPVYETLRLMYTCKHFIISNSTFGWWGQYLSRNNDKVVISPSRWNNDGFESRLIDKNWILLDT